MSVEGRFKKSYEEPKLEPSRARVKCLRCLRRWFPKRKEMPKWCPYCHHRTDGKDKAVGPLRLSITKIKRFTPAVMRKLCKHKYYRYTGRPKDLKATTTGRKRQREQSFKILDQYMQSDLNGTELAEQLGVERRALHMRLVKTFDYMLERGCFQVTVKGAEKIERERTEITRKVKSPKRKAS